MVEPVGEALAQRAKAAGIESAVFDRNGFRYHGRVKALADHLLDDALDASAVLVCGSGVESTLREADLLEAGLIVVGSHGRGAVYDALIGSFSTGIIRKSKLPVLVVPVREA